MPQKYLNMILNAPVYDVAHETPLDIAPRLSEKLDNKVLIKREDLQPVFSFKLRGAYNKLINLTNEQKRAHLEDIGRISLVENICIQEIIPPDA